MIYNDKDEFDFISRKCESEWHEDISLKKFEVCPRCNSHAYHLVVNRQKII